MLILGFDPCVCAEVDSYAVSENCFSIENAADFDCVGGVVECYNDTTHRFERRESVDWSMGVDCLGDGFEVRGGEDGGIREIGYQEGVGWW